MEELDFTAIICLAQAKIEGGTTDVVEKGDKITSSIEAIKVQTTV
jgi:hypothetical protein